MNGSFEGGTGLYGPGLLGALAELDRMSHKRTNKRTGQAWKRIMVVLAVVVTPMVVLVASGLGS